MLETISMRFAISLVSALPLASCTRGGSPMCTPGEVGCALSAPTSATNVAPATAATQSDMAGGVKPGAAPPASGAAVPGAGTGAVSADGMSTAGTSSPTVGVPDGAGAGGVMAIEDMRMGTAGAAVSGTTPAAAGARSMTSTIAGAGAASSAAQVDQNGVGLAKPGDARTASREYLNLGDMRLLVNKWGSDELGCTTSMRVFVNADKTFGWDFDRAACGGNKEKPDYPEIEFGIHPFGAGNSLATTPSFSSTAALPLQIKDITTATVNIDSLSIRLDKADSWNLNFELWLSQGNPLTEADPGVYAELITFWGWQDGRWPCDKSGDVAAGDLSYGLCHQDDQWAGGKWRYFQFRVDNGARQDFTGELDVKALLDWLVDTRGYSKDLWVTRFEVGSEIDDNTSGTVTFKNLTFEVNGAARSAQFAP